MIKLHAQEAEKVVGGLSGIYEYFKTERRVQGTNDWCYWLKYHTPRDKYGHYGARKFEGMEVIECKYNSSGYIKQEF